MPVYNGGDYLQTAIQSILAQSYKDFDFLIIDDGSTDGSQDAIKCIEDPRIQFVQNQQHCGVSITLNKGLELAASEYVARMDADDISEPDRLNKQLELMDRTPDVGICGSWVRMFSDEGKGHIVRYPLDAETIRSYILFNNPLAHPAVMMRCSMLKKHGLQYDLACGAGQDYEFWSRCLHYFKIQNIRQPLVSWRVNNSGVTQRHSGNSEQTALSVQKRELERLLLRCDTESLMKHRSIGRSIGVSSIEDMERSRLWLEEIINANRKIHYYPEKGLQRAACMIWFRLCMNSPKLGMQVFGQYSQASFKKFYRPDFQELMVFLYNYLLKR